MKEGRNDGQLLIIIIPNWEMSSTNMVNHFIFKKCIRRTVQGIKRIHVKIHPHKKFTHSAGGSGKRLHCVDVIFDLGLESRKGIYLLERKECTFQAK